MTTEERQRVNMLAAQGLTSNAIGLEIGRDRKTVLAHLQRPDAVVQVADIQERLASKFEELSERILDAVCDADLEKATLQQKAISAGVMLDKSRLIRGQSSINLAVIMATAVIEADRLSSARGTSFDPIESPL
jgi:hypothetical protein